jgi:hypothetical protein
MTAQHTQNPLVWRSVMELARGEIVSLYNARGSCLEVTSGYLWITQECDGDLLVLAGQQVRLDGMGKTVISSRKDARVALSVASEIKAQVRIERNAPIRNQPNAFRKAGQAVRRGDGARAWLRAVVKHWAEHAASGWAATH